MEKQTTLGLSIVGAYVASIAAVIAMATTVHCLGDPKFASGCGGGSLYFVVWLVFALPGLLATLMMVFTSALPLRGQVRVAVLALGLQTAWFYVLWLTRWNDALPLLGQWGVWIALAIAARVIVVASGRGGAV